MRELRLLIQSWVEIENERVTSLDVQLDENKEFESYAFI